MNLEYNGMFLKNKEKQNLDLKNCEYWVDNVFSRNEMKYRLMLYKEKTMNINIKIDNIE